MQYIAAATNSCCQVTCGVDKVRVPAGRVSIPVLLCHLWAVEHCRVVLDAYQLMNHGLRDKQTWHPSAQLELRLLRREQHYQLLLPFGSI